MSDPALLTAPPDREESSARSPMFGQTVGRYLLLGAVGRGGSGEVFAAYDPVLDRKVAIKALWRGGAPVSALVSEGRVLARLRHPNIVAIHDVIVESEQAFLAMEYFPRGDLGTWIDEHSGATWHDALPAVLAVGRGLAAAHEAEVIHGDVKPANILVADDGRFCLSDFGIARAAAERAAPPEGDGPTEVAGTWAYMAPELREGATPNERSDQYALCLVAWEVLSGQRRAMTDAPTSAAEDNETHGSGTGRGTEAKSPLHGAGPKSSVPRRVIAILERGVAPDPEARWPSVGALLTALDRAQSRRRWHTPVAVGAFTAAVVGVAATRNTERCTTGQARMDAVWGAPHRTQVERAIVETAVPGAPGVSKRVLGQLDDFADAWVVMHTETCLASADGEQSPEALDLRMGCLRRGLQALGAATRQLADADADVVLNAHQLTAGLPRLEACANLEALRSVHLPIPPDQQQAVEAAHARVADIEAHRRAGRERRALELAQDNAALTADLDYPPLAADQAMAEAGVLTGLGRYDDALPKLRDAYTLATSARDWHRAFRALLMLSFHVGFRLDRHAEGLVYADIAEGLATALSLPEEDWANLGSHRASVLGAKGDYELAIVEQRRALERRRRAGPSGDLAGDLGNLGALLGKAGRPNEAIEYHRQARDLRIETLGPEHPLTARAHIEAGNSALHLNDFDAADASLAEGVRILVAVRGDDHPESLIARLGRATSLRKQKDRTAEAESELRAIAASAGDTAPGPKVAAAATANLANLLGAAGRDDEAAVEYHRAIELYSGIVGADHPEVASMRANLALTYGQLGRFDDAKREYELALRQLEAALGPEHPDLSYPLCGLGNLYVSEGRHTPARPVLERCLAIVGDAPGQDARIAQAKFALGQALVSSDPERARALIDDAKALAEAGATVDGLEQWLADHPR